MGGRDQVYLWSGSCFIEIKTQKTQIYLILTPFFVYKWLRFGFPWRAIWNFFRGSPGPAQVWAHLLCGRAGGRIHVGGGGPGRAAGRLGAQAGAGGWGRNQAGIDGCGWILVGVGGQGAHGAMGPKRALMRSSGPKWVWDRRWSFYLRNCVHDILTKNTRYSEDQIPCGSEPVTNEDIRFDQSQYPTKFHSAQPLVSLAIHMNRTSVCAHLPILYQRCIHRVPPYAKTDPTTRPNPEAVQVGQFPKSDHGLNSWCIWKDYLWADWQHCRPRIRFPNWSLVSPKKMGTGPGMSISFRILI